MPSMDSVVIKHLTRTTQSAAMLWAECVLADMKPELAQSVTELGVDVDRLVIKRDLEEGLKWASETPPTGVGGFLLAEVQGQLSSVFLFLMLNISQDRFLIHANRGYTISS
jgi:hypothetical protein